MAFVEDSFTEASDTNLENHTGETGASWTKAPSETDTLVVDSGSNILTGSGLYYASGTPAGAEYDVEATIFTGATGVRGTEIYARGSDSAETYYRARHAGHDDEFQLDKCVNGTLTSLGTWTLVADNSEHTLKLEVRDATKKVYVDGVERISSTDNDITDAGLVGVGAFNADTNNAYLVSVSATDVASGTTENITATLAGSSQDSVGSIVLNLTGTTTLSGSSTTGGAITTDNLVAMTATLAGTSQDTAAAGLREAITATLAGTSADGGAISTGDLVMLAATLAGTSEDSGSVRAKVLLAATLAGTSEDSAEAYFGPLVPGTYTTYEAVGIREDLQGKGRERSMSRRALETAEQQLNDLLNNR